MLNVVCKDNSKTLAIFERIKDKVDTFNASFKGSDNLTLEFSDVVFLRLDNNAKIKPLVIDFCKDKLCYRLLHTSKHKEPLARAVLSGFESKPLVLDATAGLGRESMLISILGAKVIMFERNIAIWALLCDGLERACSDSLFKEKFKDCLPTLHAVGSIKDYQGVRPDVIYYDPMFPERKKSALVKKDMQIFKALIGSDDDVDSYLEYAISLATRKVVLKRPKGSEIIKIGNIAPIGTVDGGACRFDCYKAKEA